MNAEEAISKLQALDAQNKKTFREIRGKFDEHLTRIEELEAAINNQQLPQAVADAIAAVAISGQALDDIVPDAPAPPADPPADPS